MVKGKRRCQSGRVGIDGSDKIKGGNILISVHAETSDEVKRAEVIYKEMRAEDISSSRESSVPGGNT